MSHAPALRGVEDWAVGRASHVTGCQMSTKRRWKGYVGGTLKRTDYLADLWKTQCCEQITRGVRESRMNFGRTQFLPEERRRWEWCLRALWGWPLRSRRAVKRPTSPQMDQVWNDGICRCQWPFYSKVLPRPFRCQAYKVIDFRVTGFQGFKLQASGL